MPARNERKEEGLLAKFFSKREGREYFTGTDGVVENTGLEEDYTGQGISGKGIN